jgi:hypothetical protein
VAETCSGVAAGCPADQLAAAGTTCRPAAFACDNAEVCDGTSASCPPDAFKQEHDPCDDGDPATGTSACQGQQCVGVALTVVIPQPPPVPPTLPAAQVRIPIDVQIPNESGPHEAFVKLQGFVDCRELPLSVRLKVKKCAHAGGRTVDFHPQLMSGLVPITPRVKRNFGRLQPRAVPGLSLNPLGQSLFAKLQRFEQSRIPVHVSGTIGDRQGKTTTEQFPVVFLERR